VTTALAKMEKAEQWLAEAKTPEAFAEIHALADAAAQYAQAHKLETATINHCLEIQARAGRELGRLDTQPRGNPHGKPVNSQVYKSIDPHVRVDFKTLAKLPASAITGVIRAASQEGRKMSWLRVVQETRDSIRGKVAKERADTVVKVPPELREAPFQSVELPAESVDLIVTDPPYSPDDQDVYGDLSEFAFKVLRPGGICIAYSGQLGVGKNILALSEHLEFMWLFAMRHTGGEMRFRKFNVFVGWKPIIACYKEPLEAWWEPVRDFIDGGGKEKDDHEWQQAESEAAYFIERLSPPGGLVLDPMCGSGTALVAAKRLGRSYLGIDIDKEALQSAARRLAE
jgi:site-specific DNA-methyltransferase (adenine-specific)